MSIASRRVILVGDQRQLPHIVDQKIAESVVAKEQEQSELEESLFGRLYRFLENERRNGLPNRVVTLNKQFRMHPELGNFVSKNFYELYGETIESPRPALEFQHGIPAYEGKFAVWIDVPSTQGREEKVGTSWIREVEARVIAKEAKRILESNPKTTLCVISFYKKQVDLILEMLLEIGVASRDPDNGSIGIYSDQWRITTNESGETVERFRVDTVDSFQGKEFDVSMLSAVRTPDMRNPDPVRAFGHLGTMNRLCVALSRQRKLLILVGDRQGLADHPLASTYINPIRTFSQLCLEPQ
jgi:superfamily I DNA and/or RNA helicase